MNISGPIGVFDSGYGGLTILKELVAELPEYDFLYLGDNARAPYGSRSFETVYQYTKECVNWFFTRGCPLVILACNTASAKALRTIQQTDLPNINDHKRVLGVIRPTTEIIGDATKSDCIGILGTQGTVLSNSYSIEVHKFFPHVKVYQQACPMWVPLVENDEHRCPGADYFIAQDINRLLAQCSRIDSILLACTHYPLMLDKIREHTPAGITIVTQGAIVAKSLGNYLLRHPEMNERCTKNARISLFTTGLPRDFNNRVMDFFGKGGESTQIDLGVRI